MSADVLQQSVALLASDDIGDWRKAVRFRCQQPAVAAAVLRKRTYPTYPGLRLGSRVTQTIILRKELGANHSWDRGRLLLGQAQVLQFFHCPPQTVTSSTGRMLHSNRIEGLRSCSSATTAIAQWHFAEDVCASSTFPRFLRPSAGTTTGQLSHFSRRASFANHLAIACVSISSLSIAFFDGHGIVLTSIAFLPVLQVSKGAANPGIREAAAANLGVCLGKFIPRHQLALVNDAVRIHL